MVSLSNIFFLPTVHGYCPGEVSTPFTILPPLTGSPHTVKCGTTKSSRLSRDCSHVTTLFSIYYKNIPGSTREIHVNIFQFFFSSIFVEADRNAGKLNNKHGKINKTFVWWITLLTDLEQSWNRNISKTCHTLKGKIEIYLHTEIKLHLSSWMYMVYSEKSIRILNLYLLSMNCKRATLLFS